VNAWNRSDNSFGITPRATHINDPTNVVEVEQNGTSDWSGPIQIAQFGGWILDVIACALACRICSAAAASSLIVMIAIGMSAQPEPIAAS
jgi:hypothetical protein